MKRIVLTLLGFSFLVFANAQVPGTLSYQGILVNASGAPVTDGNHSVSFNFYTVSNGGAPTFSRGPFTVTTYKGMFTFLIGTGAPAGNDPLSVLPGDPNNIGNIQYFVEVVADAVPLSPRVQLSSVPYAFTAQNANTMNATGLTGVATLSNTVLDTDLQDLADGSLSGVLVGTGINAGNITTGTIPTNVLPSSGSFPDGLVVGPASQFVISAAGNVTKLNNIPSSFPPVQGAPGSLLSNDGSGNLSWVSGGGGSNWGLNGNSGTADGTSFIGTTDNIPFTIRVNNQKAGRVDHLLGNAFYGYQAGKENITGANNVASGTSTLYSTTSGNENAAFGAGSLFSNTTGGFNVAIGNAALFANVAGSNATAIGYGAMRYSNSIATPITNSNVAVGFEALRGSITSGDNTGNSNVVVGYQAMHSNTNGDANTAMGNQALYSNTQGAGNVANGFFALYSNTTGNQNVSVGRNSLNLNTVGSQNVAMGYTALNSNTSGANNTAVGSQAGFTNNPANANTTGSDNTFVGFNSGPGTTTQLNNATALGANAKVTASNAIVLGDTGSGAVNVGIGTTAPAQALDVVGSLKFSQALMPGGAAGTAGQVLTSGGAGVAPTWITVGSGGGWGLTGTSGTVDGTNFIGTTDNVPLSFKVNNQKAGRIDPTLKNVFFGYQTGNVTTGNLNTAIGNQALLSNTSGNDNIAIGTEALYFNTIGSSNFASGNYALYSNTTGNGNVALGIAALYLNTTGGSNVAVGSSGLYSNSLGAGNVATGGVALSSNTIGSFNVANGFQALNANVAGSNATAIGTSAMQYAYNGTSAFDNYNVAVGFEALRGSTSAIENYGSNNTALGYQSLRINDHGGYNTALGCQTLMSNTLGEDNTAGGFGSLRDNITGDFNVAYGSASLYLNLSGTGNTAVGYKAGFTNTPVNANITGSYNTFIGYNSGPGDSNQLTNATAIGNDATVDASNKIVLGNASAITVGGYGTFVNYSDRRLKENIIYRNDLGLNFISQLMPATYNYVKDENKRVRNGLIAQDVQRILKELGIGFSGLVVDDNTEKTMNLSYSEFVIPLITAVQEQQNAIEVQNERIRKLENVSTLPSAEVNELKRELAELRSLLTTHLGTQNLETQKNTSPSPSSIK